MGDKPLTQESEVIHLSPAGGQIPANFNNMKVEKTGVDLKQFRKYILQNYGKKCSCFLIGCACCQVWLVYEQLKDITHIIKWKKL